jgi:hypothetical protein
LSTQQISLAAATSGNAGAATAAQITKLDGIEESADVTDTTNVTAAGALMDSECTSLSDVKAINQSLISGASPTFNTTNMSDDTNKRFMSDAQESKLDGVEAAADVTDATNVEAAGAVMDSDFGSNGLMERTGSGTYGTATPGTDYEEPWSWGGALTVGDATPPVSRRTMYDCTGGTTITITDFYDTGDDDDGDFNDGDQILVLMNDADVEIDFSANANIEGNAGTDFAGSSSDIELLLFVFRNGVWYCDKDSGKTNPTTLAISNITITGTIQGAGAISEKTAATYTLGTATYDSYGTLFINADNDAIDFTLESAAAGMMACFAQGQGVSGAITVQPNTGDYLVVDGARGTAATDYTSSGDGEDKLCVWAQDDTDWIVFEKGTWSE